jgi:hypothetical protein
MTRGAIPVVGCIEDEDRQIGRCECGGLRRLRSEEVIPRAGRWFDSLVVMCTECGMPSGHIFEITPFYQARPRVWARRGAI